MQVGGFMGKRFYRSPDDRRIAGVCGGLAEYFNVDPVLVRVLFVILIFSGIGLPAYLILWLVVPVREKKTDGVEVITPEGREVPVGEPKTEESIKERKTHNLFGGIILIVLGVVFLVGNLIPYRMNKFWPVALIILGLAVLWKSNKR
jgi:phage shock protein C